MKREERNQQSRQKILDTALGEFAEKGYGLSSINTICKAGGISKGILYHYFKDKDQLYLFCVRACFDALTTCLKNRLAAGELQTPAAYFDARLTFFKEHPLYQRLFCDALLSPPPQMGEEIAEIKEEFDALNTAVLTELLAGLRLRADLDAVQIIEVIRLFQDFVNARFRMAPNSAYDLERHEKLCSRALDLLLYGAVERGFES